MQKVVFFLVPLLFYRIVGAQDLKFPKIPADRMAYIQEVLGKAVATKDSAMLAEAWFLYGKTHAGIGDYSNAQAYFFKSLRIQERFGDSFELGRLYLRIGSVECAQGNFRQALNDINQAKRIFERVKSSRGILSYYQSLSVIYESRWNEDSLTNSVRFDSLLHIYKIVERLAAQSGNKENVLALAAVNLSLGNLYVKKKPALSIQYTGKAIELYRDRNEVGFVAALAGQAPAYVCLLQYSRALQVLTMANKYYRELKVSNLDLQIVIYRNYVQYFDAIRDWQSAFSYQRKLSEYEKEKIIADRNGEITRLALDYQTEKKEKQLRAQKREIRLRDVNLRTQQRFIWVFAVLLATALGVGIFYFRLYRQNKRTSRWNAELLKEQNHRVKNNLQIVISLLNLQSKRLKDGATKSVVDEMRLRVESMAILHRTLYDGEKSIKVELNEFIREVVQGVLKSYGFEHIKPDFDVEYLTLDADKAVRFGLILNELCTNACKYAFSNNPDPKFIVRCREANQTLDFMVKDNGPGLSDVFAHTADRILHSKGHTLGISLVRSLVVQLGGVCYFRNESGGTETGTTFNLKFKL